MSFAKKLLNLKENSIDLELAYIVDSLINSSISGLVLMFGFLIVCEFLPSSIEFYGIFEVKFELAYFIFHLGFGLSGLISIAKRLAIRIVGMDLIYFYKNLSRSKYALISFYAFKLSISLFLAYLVGCIFIALASGMYGFTPIVAYWINVLLLCFSISIFCFGLSSLAESAKEVRKNKFLLKCN